MEAATTRRAFAVLGTTDDVTTCELCGRDDLKSTTILAMLDADGNRTGETVYYGSACGARVASWTTGDLRAAAKHADTARRAAEQAARQAETLAHIAARDAWIAANIAPDALDHPRRYGYPSPYAVVQAYDASRAIGIGAAL